MSNDPNIDRVVQWTTLIVVVTVLLVAAGVGGFAGLITLWASVPSNTTEGVAMPSLAGS